MEWVYINEGWTMRWVGYRHGVRWVPRARRSVANNGITDNWSWSGGTNRWDSDGGRRGGKEAYEHDRRFRSWIGRRRSGDCRRKRRLHICRRIDCWGRVDRRAWWARRDPIRRRRWSDRRRSDQFGGVRDLWIGGNWEASNGCNWRRWLCASEQVKELNQTTRRLAGFVNP